MTDDTYTAAELVTILDNYWEKTAEWDPWLNGEMEAELRDLDPKVPAQLEERRRIVDRHSFSHDLLVGQRTAIGLIKRAIADGRLREASRDYWTPVGPREVKEAQG